MKALDELPGVRETHGIIPGSIRTQKDRDLSDLMVIHQINYNGRKLQWAHIPNQGKRSGKTAKILEMMGLKKGLLDILIFDSPPAYPLMKGAALELKKLKGGKVSDEQNEWLTYFENNSWVTGVAESLSQALDFLRNWGYIK
jgi:hypothetical protein